MISIIAAIGKNNELGKDNQLIFHIKDDMKFFKDTTMGHEVVMGAKTFQSIGRPLPGRQNYVVTHHPDALPAGVAPISDLTEFLAAHQATPDEIFVIGGASVYAAALPYTTTLYLTEISAPAADADTFFPNFDHSQYRKTIIKEGKENDLSYSFVKYIKK